ncbi:MAG TPA: hypothetical protein VGX46_10965, partial [Vicinamibacterales bacterium]|nr:hypothetical protein [Vicinamibacterales bacterium]
MRSAAALLALALVGRILSPPPETGQLAVADLDRDVRAFLAREMAAHLADIHQLSPPQDRVVGALTTGEYTWGTFMRSLAVYGELSGAATLAGRNIARQLGDLGLVEVRLGGTRFSQLYAALALRSYGVDLSRNAIWQSLTPEERTGWATLLDATKFYDPLKKQVINLPENYLGVAARIAAMSFEMGFLKDRAMLDGLLDRAAVQFTSGARFADDALPTGRYDRYSNEYARFVWDAAEIAGRKDLLDALRPTLRTQMKLWWDLVAPDGYGYPWGRSLGLVSYLDTLEIPGFLALNPEFRPAPLDQLAAEYNRAWRWLRKDFKDDRHLLSLFDFGRGNFSYISIDREWQQTTGSLGKVADAHMRLMKGLAAEHVTAIPEAPALPAVARFEFFKETGRQAGVWLVRQGEMRFALPFTTATRPGVADYLPAPHGLPGFAAPVEQRVPALVPFVDLEDGRTIAAADGADTIVPAADGRGLRAHWNQWAVVGGKAGERTDPGLQSDVAWALDGDTLVRTERLTASRPLRVKRWYVIVPVTGSRSTTSTRNGVVTDTFDGPDG